MNKFSFNRYLKYLAYIMIVTQGIIIALVASFHLNSIYFEKFIEYHNSFPSVRIRSIPEEKKLEVLGYFREYTQKNKVFL